MAKNNSIDVLSLTETCLDHSFADLYQYLDISDHLGVIDRVDGVVGWLYIVPITYQLVDDTI